MSFCDDERSLLADDVEEDSTDTLADTLPEVSSEEETESAPNLVLPMVADHELKVQLGERLRLLQEEQKEAKKQLFEVCQRLNVPTASKSFPPPRPPWVKPPPVPITMCFASDGSRVFLFPPSISRSAREAYLSVCEEIYAEVLQEAFWEAAHEGLDVGFTEYFNRHGRYPEDDSCPYQLTNPLETRPAETAEDIHEDSQARWQRLQREDWERRQIIQKTAPEGSTLYLEAIID